MTPPTQPTQNPVPRQGCVAHAAQVWTREDGSRAGGYTVDQLTLVISSALSCRCHFADELHVTSLLERARHHDSWPVQPSVWQLPRPGPTAAPPAALPLTWRTPSFRLVSPPTEGVWSHSIRWCAASSSSVCLCVCVGCGQHTRSLTSHTRVHHQVHTLRRSGTDRTYPRLV